ncbi:MAG TPA: hypothetical protein VJR58_26110 [Vineibacter sp.]|nr:hypothetical protein [Vineibacter sp.]
MVRSRLFIALPLALMVTGLAACDDPTPEPPQRVQPPPQGNDQNYPNLGTVPARPQTSTAADRAVLAGQLASDRARARYGSEAQPVDETRGSTIGSQVRGKPPQADEPSAPSRPPSASEPPTPTPR